jgi:hypothetical protein
MYYCLAEFSRGAGFSRLDQQKFILRNFNFMKRKNALQSVAKHERGEAEWNSEVNEIRKTALLLWHDLLTLESYYCLEIQDRVDFLKRFASLKPDSSNAHCCTPEEIKE